MILRRLLLIIFLASLLSACSTQFGYRLADTFLEWQLGKYVEVSGQLERDIDASIDELHLWHARSELPRYRDLLDELLTDLDRGDISETTILSYSEHVYDLWRRIRYQVEPYAQVYLPRLSIAQRQQLIDNLAQRLEEEREEAQQLSAEERFEQSYERMIERAEEWLGRVHADQRRILRRWVTETEQSDRLWLTYQESWLEAFQEALADPADKSFSDQIQLLMTEPELLRSAELQAQIVRNRQLGIAALNQLYKSLSEPQKLRLKSKLRDYRATLTELIEHYRTD
ncbi:DUF6279 family lipoprotein [Pseudidiomarina insulisalsae]|uniref:Lipoprotein n=1 Tax=Pseudidiomarina insulisalsae TaxID=575789 RepID=A0A432YH62_9GAMM|nr:DUF6279 family lipoprotein [Pseudidiomarina insulisalsae]RUO60286.1 hypothetical protein CWI71_07725 [Pseudidiomarina insulisalsae]